MLLVLILFHELYTTSIYDQCSFSGSSVSGHPAALTVLQFLRARGTLRPRLSFARLLWGSWFPRLLQVKCNFGVHPPEESGELLHRCVIGTWRGREIFDFQYGKNEEDPQNRFGHTRRGHRPTPSIRIWSIWTRWMHSFRLFHYNSGRHKEGSQHKLLDSLWNSRFIKILSVR